MTDLRKAAQQALEALDCLEAPPTGAINHYELERRKNALRAALAEPDVPEAVSSDSKNPRDKDDVPLERAVLVREWKAMRLALSTPRSNPYVPLTDEQIGAAINAWFEYDIVADQRSFAERMRSAIEAAHGIGETK